MLFVDQEPAVRVGDGDEAVGDRREHAIEPADAVGPAGAVECGEDDRHADATGGEPAPEHLVAGADGDDGVDLAVAEQLGQPRPDAQIVFAREQRMVDGNFSGQHFAERAAALSGSRARGQSGRGRAGG